MVYDAPYYLPFKSAGNDRNDDPAQGTTVYRYTGGAWVGVTYNTSAHPKGDGQYKGGFDTIPTIGNAKNIMTVGAIDDAENGSTRKITSPYAAMSSFSGWGPADDGRIKPDIVANGIDLYSCTDVNNSSYDSFRGTSMSSPNACGSAALLVDYFDDRFPGDAMRASTLKGLIIHTADDLGRPGPDYSYGWGLMNTLAAAELIEDYADGNPLRMTEALLHSTTNTSDSITIFSGGVDPVRVTLCWTDPPGTSTSTHDSRTARLVNDLDLKVVGPNGTFYPYSLSYLTPTADATTSGENNIDNVEQVFIETPLIGQYTITVDYDGSLSSSKQWYSLLIDGNASDSDSDNIPDYWETTYFLSPTGAVASADSDGDGADNLTEYISGHNPTNADSVFEMTSFSVPPTGGVPFIVTWDSVEGRIYDVKWTGNLIYTPFTTASGELPYPANSYTDSVPRAGQELFYRVDVKLDQ